MRKQQVLLDPTNRALATGLCFFFGAFGSHGLRPESNNLFPPFVVAWMSFTLYSVGFGLFVWTMVSAWRKWDGRLFWLGFLGFAVGGAMAGVVQNEPQNFYGVSAGVFASLILAMAATRIGTPTTTSRSNPMPRRPLPRAKPDAEAEGTRSRRRVGRALVSKRK